MDKLEEISRTRKKAHARLVALKSTVYAAFLELQDATYRDGVVARKHKELIAVGISVAKDCESCMQWHIEQAAAHLDGDLDCRKDLFEGGSRGGGPATVSARFALEVLDSVITPSQER